MPPISEVMPDPEEMMRRLMAFDNTSWHMVENLYPRIVRQLAGQEKNGTGVVRGASLAIADYGADIGGQHGSIVATSLTERLGHLVMHLLGESKMLGDAQETLREMGITT